MKTIAKLMALCMLLGTLAIAQPQDDKKGDEKAAAATEKPKKEKKAKKEKKEKKDEKKAGEEKKADK